VDLNLKDQQAIDALKIWNKYPKAYKEILLYNMT